MEIIPFLAMVIAFGILKTREQQRRIALLSGQLGKFEIEKLMESLVQGYMRALDEKDPERAAQIWAFLQTQEQRLRDQLQQFSEAFSHVWTDKARVSTLAIAIPFADKLFPRQAFDLRRVFEIHARGIDQVVANVDKLEPKDRAFTLTAELLLLQHTCHWFCRSRAVASARLLAQHQTRYAQVVNAVSPATRRRYEAVIACRPMPVDGGG